MPVRSRKKYLPEAPPAAAGTTPGAPPVAGALPGLLAAVPVPLAVLRQGRVVEQSPACAELLRRELGGPGHGNARWLAGAATRLLANGTTRETLPGKGGARTLEVRVGPALADGAGHLVAVDVVAAPAGTDDDLVATVSTLSHELRTPLASMKSSLGLVLGGDAGPVLPDQERFLGMTMRNIDRLERLVSDLLDVARSERGRTALDRREVDLAAVLREAVQMHEAEAASRGLGLDTEGIAGSLPGLADPDRLTQVVANLLGNALKFTPAGGTVRVAASAAADTDPLAAALAAALGRELAVAGITVADDGVGMEPAELDQVFEPWFRGRGGDASPGPGSGLGLHITRDLVAGHGGWIGVASRPGAGTTVRVGLPRDRATEAVLRAARELRAQAQPTDEIVMLDARGLDGATAAVDGFLAWRGEAGLRRPCAPAPGVVALAVPDAADWQATWEIHGRERPDVAALPAWRQVGGVAGER